MSFSPWSAQPSDHIWVSLRFIVGFTASSCSTGLVGGLAWVYFRSDLKCIFEILCFSQISLRNLYILDPWIYDLFSLCSSMDQLSAYGEADKPPTSPSKESGTVEAPSKDTSVSPDLAQDGLPGPPTSPLTRRGPDLVIKTSCHRPPSLFQKGSRALPVYFLLLRTRNHMIRISSEHDMPRWT